MICNEIKCISLTLRSHNILKYSLIVHLAEILFSSVSRAVAFGAEGTGFDPSSRRYNGGSGGGLNLKHFSGNDEVGHFIRPGIPCFTHG